MDRKIKTLIKEREAIDARCNCGVEPFFANCDNCKVNAEKIANRQAMDAYWQDQGPRPCEIITEWKRLP